MLVLCKCGSVDSVFEVDFVTHVAIWEHVSDVGEGGVSEFAVLAWVDNLASGSIYVALETEHGEGECMSGGGDGWCDGTEVFGGVQGEGSGFSSIGRGAITVVLEGNGEGVLVDDVGDQARESVGLDVAVDGDTRLPDGDVQWCGTFEPRFGIGSSEVPVPCAPFAVGGVDLTGAAVGDGVSDLSEVSSDDDVSGSVGGVGVVVSDVIVEHGVDQFSLSGGGGDGTTGDGEEGIVDHEIVVRAGDEGVEGSPGSSIWPQHSAGNVKNVLVELGARARVTTLGRWGGADVSVVTLSGAVATSAKTDLTVEAFVGDVGVGVLWDTAGIGEGVVKDGVSDVRSGLHVDDGPMPDAPDGLEVDDDVEVGSGIDLGTGTTVGCGWFDGSTEVNWEGSLGD